MFFVLRLVFWLALVCLLLPGVGGDAGRHISSVEQTATDVKGFCQRNAAVCEDARATMTLVLAKLKSGAQAAQAWIDEQKRQNPELQGPVREAKIPSMDQSLPAGAPRPVVKWHDNLRATDRDIPWQEPQSASPGPRRL
jgi:hypothetical protein